MNANVTHKQRVSVVGVMAVLLAAGVMLWMVRYWSTPTLRDALDHGSSNVQIESIVVNDSDGSTLLLIDDADFIDALNRSLLKGAEGTDSVQRHWLSVHRTYAATVLMSSGSRTHIRLSVFRSNEGIAVEIVAPFAIVDDTYPYWIPFREPISDNIKNILEWLRLPPGKSLSCCAAVGA